MIVLGSGAPSLLEQLGDRIDRADAIQLQVLADAITILKARQILTVKSASIARRKLWHVIQAQLKQQAA